MPKIIIANWKMNPETREEAIKLAKESDAEGLIIAPPFVFIEDVKANIEKAELGAQDLFWEEKGAFTGEVSAKELKALGVKYAIIGHSERRRNLGETDEIIAKKIESALRHEITPILCVGESSDERASGKTQEIISRQLRLGLSLISKMENGKWKMENPQEAIIHYPLSIELVIAYEPLWAIGTGSPDTPQDMINMVQYIKEEIKKIFPELVEGLQLSLIYGGSVTSENVEEFLKHKEIDGVLVGGASLKPEEIIRIVQISAKY